MNTKSDWQRVNQELMAEQRRTLGDPPAADEMIAYMNGELPPEQEERIRAFIACDPELARAVATTFDEEASDISDAEVARRFSALQKQIRAKETHREAGRVFPFRLVSFGLAAALVIVFGLYWQAERRLANERRTPYGVVTMTEIRPGAQRGTGGVRTLPGGNVDFALRHVTSDVMHNDDYRVEIAAAGTKTPLWGETGVLRTEENEFLIFVPRKALERGQYDITLYGLAGDTPQIIETYRVQIP